MSTCQDATVSAGPNCTADASIDNNSFDPNGDPITLTQDPTGPYPLGDTLATLTVTDDSGESSQCSATVSVVDDKAPVLSTNAGPITLWPPNHKYHTIAAEDLVASVSDNCAALSASDVVITKVTSDEPEDVGGGGDGNTTDDIVIASDCKSVDLRSERQGGGNGRVYTVHLSVGDGSSNSSSDTFQVQVPHNKKDTAVDDGPAYEVTCGS